MRLDSIVASVVSSRIRWFPSRPQRREGSPRRRSSPAAGRRVGLQTARAARADFSAFRSSYQCKYLALPFSFPVLTTVSQPYMLHARDSDFPFNSSLYSWTCLKVCSNCCKSSLFFFTFSFSFLNSISASSNLSFKTFKSSSAFCLTFVTMLSV